MAVPGVVSVTGLFAVPFREMFGLWRLSRSMRAAHRAEDEEFAQL
jgi:hypothetical protein